MQLRTVIRVAVQVSGDSSALTLPMARVRCLWRWELLVASDEHKQLKHSRNSLVRLPCVDMRRSEIGKNQMKLLTQANK